MNSTEVSALIEYSPNTPKRDVLRSYLPMIIAQLYLLFTVVVFFFGPWPWPVTNTPKLLLLLGCCHIMLGIGYFIGIKTKKVIVHHETYNINRLIKISLLVSLVMIMPLFYARTGLYLFDVPALFSSIYEGIFNPGEQYMQKILSSINGDSNFLLTLLTILGAPFHWLLLPVALIFWKEVKKSYKVLIILLTIIDILSWVVIGTNKGIFDLIIILTSALIIQRANTTEIKQKNINGKQIIKYLLIVLVIISAISYFSNTIESRMGKINTFNNVVQIEVDENRFLYKFTPEFMKGTSIAFGSYLTQGYYGLSLALNESYTPTFGMGNSTFFMSIVEERLGLQSVKLNTYPYKIQQYGWDMYVNWHTFYTWFASDISFWALPLLMFVIGYFISVIWKDIILNKNPYAVSLFSLMMILVFYIPANNQVFSFPHTFFSFYLLLFMWIISNKRKKEKEKL